MGKQKNCSVLLHEGLKGVDDMYNQRKYSMSDNYTIPSSGCKSRRIKNSRKKKARFRRKATAIAFSAVIFGGMAGGTFYGVNTLLNHLPNQTDYDTQKSNAILSPVSYSLDSVAMSQSLDVTEIAAQGLPSVVSVKKYICPGSTKLFWTIWAKRSRASTAAGNHQLRIGCNHLRR